MTSYPELDMLAKILRSAKRRFADQGTVNLLEYLIGQIEIVSGDLESFTRQPPQKEVPHDNAQRIPK